jgi:flagellar FliL protein
MSNGDRDDLLDDAANELRRGDDDYSPAGGKGSGKKKLLLVLLAILILGGGAGVHFSGILDEIAQEKKQAKVVVDPIPEKTKYFDLPDMLVNLNSVGPKPNFLKLRASLELAEGADTLWIRKLTPRIIDIFQVYMRELRLDDLRANGGLYRLRAELRSEINKAVSPVEVNQVLFRNMLVQ